MVQWSKISRSRQKTEGAAIDSGGYEVATICCVMNFGTKLPPESFAAPSFEQFGTNITTSRPSIIDSVGEGKEQQNIF